MKTEPEGWGTKAKASRSMGLGCLLLAVAIMVVCAVLAWYLVFAVPDDAGPGANCPPWPSPEPCARTTSP